MHRKSPVLTSRIQCILVKSLDWTHGGLDVETLDVLPVLLQQGDQEVHGQVNVLDQFFFIWNLMVDFRSKAFCSKLSLWVTKVGNLPALFNPGPNNLGICLIRVSEARKASYLAASFLTFFLSLFSFLRSSADMASMPRALASSICC